MQVAKGALVSAGYDVLKVEFNAVWYYCRTSPKQLHGGNHTRSLIA
jgi:hypothetical protein